ncbi:MAG TPA: efflux transporter outer membrane subunit [Kiritimatiellia bacterium]|nr:efflux transporter outer membrane subunit [Kiritimatiellia bacterium]HMP97099.1 efflux transporter outer membrane subunit [Kiritimatiellia bacterium]
MTVLTVGCATVGPDYTPPDQEWPAAWRGAAGEDDAALGSWWTLLNDPALEDVLEKVRANNRQLAAAAANLERYAALYGMTRAEALPQVGGQIGAAYDRQTESVRRPPGVPIPDNPGWIYQAGFSMAWEVDLWGRVRRSMEAARGKVEVAEEDIRNALVLLQAQAAVEYIQVRALQARLAVAEENIALQRETLRVVQGRFDAGLTGEADVFQAEMNLAATEAQVPSLRTKLEEGLNALCVLAGTWPGGFDALRAPAAVPSAQTLPGMVPAELARRRPDIRSAERELAAQTARIGAARAELYPKLALNGAFAFAATDTGDLFNSPARTFTIGPLLSMPLFTGGKIRSAVRAEEAGARMALARYEQAVLVALAECENALAGFAESGTRLRSLREAAVAADRSVGVVNELYRSGLTDFQRVLDAQRQRASLQDAMAQAEGIAAASLVAVYKAFGGGW